MIDPVDAILAAHGFAASWTLLDASGVANRVYVTDRVVLRVATDHADAVADALTESVAAPAAHAAGVRTPRLLAFDDSRAIVDRPFSIWDRVHGETLGTAGLDIGRQARVWYEVGREIAKLHGGVGSCPDPHGYLDAPGYERDAEPVIARLVDRGGASIARAREIEALLERLAPHVSAASHDRCFVHNDLHAMNVMCTPEGDLLALIDWGDAGWGDPVLDFVDVPFETIDAALEGYGAANRTRFGAFPEARIVWAKLHHAMYDAIDQPGRAIPLTRFRRFLDRR